MRRTVLMISHRLSTLGDVDEIVVLQRDGSSSAALKRAGGVFAGLLEEQIRYSAERVAQGRGRVVVAAPAAGLCRDRRAAPPGAAAVSRRPARLHPRREFAKLVGAR
jgi:hypothetical protein